jgi:hypothetical protein
MHRSALEGLSGARDAARLVFSDGVASEPSVARAIAAHDQAWRRLLAGLLARAREAGCLRDGVDASLASEAILGSLHRVVRQRLLREGGADAEALATSLARLHAASLSPDAKS